MLVLITALVFALAYLILLMYYRRHWFANQRFQLPEDTCDNAFISVIIAARNEEKNITALLDAISRQTLSPEKFEVIIIDDYSTDHTAQLVLHHSLKNTRLISPRVLAAHSSKKKAIEAGIAEAKGELIVTTDADCIPLPTWLESLHRFYQKKEAAFIAGPVRFNPSSNLLDLFQTCDFLMLQGITATQVHGMCNGANLAYRKTDFNLVRGFEGIDQVATGDDMLLMHKIKKLHPGKVYYFKAKEAIVETEPMPTWKTFIMQRKRWASKTMIYDEKKIIYVLGFVYLFNCLCLLLAITGFFFHLHWWAFLIVFIVKVGAELFFIRPVAEFFDQAKLLPWFVLLQLPHIIYTVVVGLISQVGRYEWKGRTTK